MKEDEADQVVLHGRMLGIEVKKAHVDWEIEVRIEDPRPGHCPTLYRKLYNTAIADLDRIAADIYQGVTS